MSTSKVLSRSIKIKELYWKIKGANLTQFQMQDVEMGSTKT